MNRLPVLTVTFALAALVGGCAHRSNNNTAKASPLQVKAARQEQASDRVLLDEIPPPAKSRYLAIHTKASWDNPFLVVTSQTVSLRVMNPAPPHSSLVPGGEMMQPVSARKNILELRLSDLPEALASVPGDDWPYGRVIAVEEDPSEVRANRVQVRRNVEATIRMLNNLGVVVYEWPRSR
ncbi:MAG: hypothetical protein WAM66_06640 [Acidobacteriaceae bacterium]